MLLYSSFNTKRGFYWQLLQMFLFVFAAYRIWPQKGDKTGVCEEYTQAYKLRCWNTMSTSRINKNRGKKNDVWRHSAKITDLSFTLGLTKTNQSTFRHHRKLLGLHPQNVFARKHCENHFTLIINFMRVIWCSNCSSLCPLMAKNYNSHTNAVRMGAHILKS